MANSRRQFYQSIKAFAIKLGEQGFYDWLERQDDDTRAGILSAFDDPAFRLEDYQLPPDQPWRVWFLQMGRGTGKTHAASCEVNRLAEEEFPGCTGLLVGATVKDVRDTMIQGASGLIATARPDFVPRYSERTNTVYWPNGSKALVRTADNPEDIRGPTVNWAWCDELVKWPSEASYSNVDFCVREQHENGTKIILTTTPKQAKEWIKALADETIPGTVVSRASTLDNPHLDPTYRQKVERELALGSRRAREEILGEWTTGDSQLWDEAAIEAVRDKPNVSLKAMADSMDRRVISVDPAKGVGKDETGLLLIGWKGGKAHVLADFTEGGSTEVWTTKVVQLAKDYFKSGDYVLLETNFNESAQNVLQMKNRNLRVVPVIASRSKWDRAQEAYSHFCAERVRFWHTHPKLEKQLCEWEPEMKKSPDRGDAFTQAINHLCKQSPAPKTPFMSLAGLRL
jgi:phage terminase large subunit-like protein